MSDCPQITAARVSPKLFGFKSVKDPDFDFTLPTGNLFLTILAALNQYYLDLLRQHTAKSKRERARQGLYNASITPYGYRHVGDARTPPEVVEAEAAAVRLAFETYAAGTYSYQEVADRLTETGYRTRTGRPFGKDSLDEMLRNQFYAGQVAYGLKRPDQPPEFFPAHHHPGDVRELRRDSAQTAGSGSFLSGQF